MVRRDRRYSKNPDFIFRVIGNETLLIPVKSRAADFDSLYTLNEVAARIWELIDGTRDTDEIRDAVFEEFLCDHSTMEKDLRAFLAQLQEVGAVVEVS